MCLETGIQWSAKKERSVLKRISFILTENETGSIVLNTLENMDSRVIRDNKESYSS